MWETLESNGGSRKNPGQISVLLRQAIVHNSQYDAPPVLQSGQSFDKVAQEYSEDKAKGNNELCVID